MNLVYMKLLRSFQYVIRSSDSDGYITRTHRYTDMKNRVVLILPWLLISLIWISTDSLQAQSTLERVTVSERADGRGFVIRNHLSALPDSFRVVQTSAERVQFMLYGVMKAESDFSTASVEERIPELFQAFNLIEEALEFGMELHFSTGGYFRASAYPDVNGRDILIGLERIAEESFSPEIITEVPEGSEFEERQLEEKSEIAESVTALPVVQREARRFGVETTFGIRGGITRANIYGAGYARDPRMGTTMGMSVDMAFRFGLPYNLTTGLETGVSYTEKGFENPNKPAFFDQNIEIDYIEIPILARIGYEELWIFTPYIAAGSYIGFMASAERVREDGSRSDLDDQVSHVEFGWIGGAGVDIRIGDVIASFQIRQSVGQSHLFSDPQLNSGEKNRQLSLVFGLRF